MTASPLPWQADKPYNQLPPLPPVAELETRAVLKRCIEARTALAELKQAAELMPHQPQLDFGLFRILHARSAQITAIINTEPRSKIYCPLFRPTTATTLPIRP